MSKPEPVPPTPVPNVPLSGVIPRVASLGKQFNSPIADVYALEVVSSTAAGHVIGVTLSPGHQEPSGQLVQVVVEARGLY